MAPENRIVRSVMMKISWLAGIALLIVAAASVALLRCWPPTSSADVASWGQAVSTTAAVVVALFVAAWQHEMQREREAGAMLRDKAPQCETAYQLAGYVETVCKKVLGSLKESHHPDRVYLTDAAGEFEAIGVAFEKYRPADFGTYEQLKPLVAIMAARAALLRHLERALSRMDAQAVRNELLASFDGAVKSIEENVAKLKVSADLASIAAG
jgi:hypothetical protein